MNGMTGLFDTLRDFAEQRLLPHYQDLAQREQYLVAGLALFLAIILPLFGVVLPLEDKRKVMIENVYTLQVQAAEANRLADQLMSGGKLSANENIMAVVDRIARSSGVRGFMTKISPQLGIGDKKGLMVQLKDAPYRKTVAFISALSDKGFGLSRMSLLTADRSGHVHLKAVIIGN